MDIQPEQLDFLNVKESADQMSFEGRIQKLKMPKRQEQLKHFEKLTTFANWRSDGKKKKKGGKKTFVFGCLKIQFKYCSGICVFQRKWYIYIHYLYAP